ncbi:MAG TPA: TonB-dependent receptor [Gammaproteobacteria bacterium]
MSAAGRRLHADGLKPSVAAASGGAILASALVALPAPQAAAQDTLPQQLDEITVTGTRILRRDYQSNSPIVTVDSDAFETQTGLNVESYLNQLPQYNPAASPVTTEQDVQITPVNSVGIASISLRGFGPNRSLVLVDGKRMVPINALMVTDVNSIPSALIERVETITGGASAVYGADAVGGVTNFILRDDFEGFDIDMQHGATQEGDGEESRLSVVMGTNFDEGRGNITLGFESYNRDPAFEAEHDFFREEVWANPDIPGSFLFLQGVNGYNCFSSPFPTPPGNCPNINTVNALFADRPAGTNVFHPALYGSPFGGQFNFNPDGTVFVANSQGGLYRADGSLRFTGTVDGSEYGFRRTLDTSIPPGDQEYLGLKWHNQRAFISAPQERHSFFTSGKFDINDRTELFARASFAESKTRTLLFGTNAISGWEGFVPYDPTTDSPVDPSLDFTDPAVVAAVLANPDAYMNPSFIKTGDPGAQHPVPLQLAILLNSRPNPTGVWQPDWNPDDSLPPRQTTNTNTVWQVETGVNFEIGDSWTGEFYLAHGESSTYNVAGGNLSLQRYRALIQQPDYGRGAALTGNVIGAARPAFGAGDVTCTSGFYDTFFAGDAPLSQDCFEAVNATLQTRTQNTQDIVELNFQGGVFELPAGEVRAAAGFQSRRNTAQFYPDILQSEVSFTDQVIGVYPTGYLDASTSVKDYYLEGLIPVISGKRGAQLLELELGARYSDYEHTDEENTWKALINWQINDWARLRGGFNRATRAPNLGELFLNPQEIFTVGGNFADACALRSNAPYGAGGTGPDPSLDPGEPQPVIAPGQTPEGAQSTRLICEALMGGPGSPAVQQFYHVSNAAPPGPGGGFAWVMQQGNRNLKSETADTWTFGFVANSPFEAEWLSNATVSLDWYKVEIDNAIMLYSLDYAAYRCFGSTLVTTPEEAAIQAATPACQLLPRDQVNGAPLTTSVSYDNQATIETAGMDIALNWFTPLRGPGTLGVNLQATYLDYYRTKQSPAVFDVVTDWKGSLGPTLTGTNGGAYDYRLFSSLSYSRPNWTVNLRWRYLPSVWSANHASQQAIIENNARVTAGGPGVILGYTPSTEIKTDSYSVFDLSFNYNINEQITLRGGITNLLDTDPEFSNQTRGFPPGVPLDSYCNGAPGCQNPTSYQAVNGAGGAAILNGGYYDLLGRRFFVGLNVRF